MQMDCRMKKTCAVTEAMRKTFYDSATVGSNRLIFLAMAKVEKGKKDYEPGAERAIMTKWKKAKTDLKAKCKAVKVREFFSMSFLFEF